MDATQTTLRDRVLFWQWGLPAALIVAGLLYPLGIGYWMDATPFRVGLVILAYATLGPLLGYLAMRDLRQRLDTAQAAQKRTEALNRRLAAITATAADAVLSLDTQGRIEVWNEGAEWLFGFTAAETLGQPFSALLGGSSAAVVEYHWLREAVLQAGFVRGHETTGHDAAGRRLAVELTAALLPGEEGQPAGLSIIIRDITRRKQREEETQRLNATLNHQAVERNRELAEKVEALGRANAELQKLDQTRSEFVSLVSHQIRAPLTNMGGAVQRMQADCRAVNPTCGRMFVIVEQQIRRLDSLVKDVLNAARLEAGEVSFHPEPISMMPVAEQVIEQARARMSSRVINLADKPGLPLVYADRSRLAEVLANLLDNADKYSPPGQPITVRARADQTEVTVAVRDGGAGLPPNNLERVFDKFYRTDSSDAQTAYGYGLGLYVCRRLMEGQGGRIWAENHPDGGAVFSFALPVWQEEHDQANDLAN
ncbi:MAG: PAS domain-containing sensor histidine kinase [Chloroflexota bacterium]